MLVALHTFCEEMLGKQHRKNIVRDMTFVCRQVTKFHDSFAVYLQAQPYVTKICTFKKTTILNLLLI